MIDLIREKLKAANGMEMKIHWTREFLQLLTLKVLGDRAAFKHLAFVGGTALRILYDLKRFSEDLDFSLMDEKGYDFETLTKKVLLDVGQSGFDITMSIKQKQNVQSAMLKFKGLLWALGLSGFKDELLSVKLDVDTNPPTGANTQMRLVVKDFAFSVRHFDLPSLFATKLHACFYRKYVKGRDFYDLVWYIGQKIGPNFELLNQTVLQTEKVNPKVSRENFKDYMRTHLEPLDFKRVKQDVERFMLDKSEIKLLDKNLILSSL